MRSGKRGWSRVFKEEGPLVTLSHVRLYIGICILCTLSNGRGFLLGEGAMNFES